MTRHTPRVLITAGPTYEAIDAVRFIGNRSSGTMGVALANACIAKHLSTTLMLGPSALILPSDPTLTIKRFESCADLQALLTTHAPQADIIIMAAAVADFRPKPNPSMSGGKFRRTSGTMTLELESTPDLLSGVSALAKPNQTLIGFALEPANEMIASAQAKLARKKVHMVVANPLETMNAPTIDATLVMPNNNHVPSDGLMTKADFAYWLLQKVLELHASRQISGD